MIFLKCLKNFVIKNRIIIFCLFIIFCLGLIPISWFKGNYLFSGTDFYFPPNGINTFKQLFFLWDSRNGGVFNSIFTAFLLPQGIFLGLSDLLGLSLSSAQKIWLCYIFMLSGFSAFFLIISIVKEKYKYFMGIVAASFYMFNIYMAIGITMYPYLLLSYASLPLKLGLFIKGIKEKKGLKFIIILALIWQVTSSSQYSSPRYFVLDWLPLLLYLFIFIISNRRWVDIKKSLKFTIILFGLLLFLNLFWLLPDMYNFRGTINFRALGYSNIRTDLNSYAINSSSLIDAIRLQGLWIFHSGYRDYPHFYWAKIYNTPFFVFISYLVPLLAFLSLIIGWKKRGESKFLKMDNNINLLFFSFLTLISIFLITGSTPPFGKINLFIFTKLKIVNLIFITPYQIIGIFLCIGYSFLISNAVVLLFELLQKNSTTLFIDKLKKITGKLLIALVYFLIIFVYAYPLWTGDVFYPGNKILASSRYKIPNYYFQAENWIKSKEEEFSIFQLPYQLLYGCYLWEPNGYNGPDYTGEILGKSILRSVYCNGIIKNAANLMINNKNNNVSKLLSLLNVRYILFQRDANFDFVNTHDWYISTSIENFINILRSLKYVTLEKSIGMLDFYRITDQVFLPKIYTSNNAVLLKNLQNNKDFVNEMCKLVVSDNFDINNNLILLSNLLYADQEKIINKNIEKINFPLSSINKTSIGLQNSNNSNINNNSKPKITFRKVSPVEYAIDVENATEPFFLVFSEGYDTNWKAYTKGEIKKFDNIIAEYPNNNVIEVKNDKKLNLADFFFLFSKPLDEKYHFVANGYSNAWYINPEGNKSSFEIILYFKAQNIYYVGLLISGFIFAGCIFYLFLIKIKGKNKKYNKM